MIKISKLADYAVVILACLAKVPNGDVMSAAAISAETRLPEATVSKVLKLLGKGGVTQSLRGLNGGYALRVLPEEVTVADIITSVDGPIAITACVDGAEPDCSLAAACCVRGRWDDVNFAIRNVLEGLTLADMMREQGGQDFAYLGAETKMKEKEDIHGCN